MIQNKGSNSTIDSGSENAYDTKTTKRELHQRTGQAAFRNHPDTRDLSSVTRTVVGGHCVTLRRLLEDLGSGRADGPIGDVLEIAIERRKNSPHSIPQACA